MNARVRFLLSLRSQIGQSDATLTFMKLIIASIAIAAALFLPARADEKQPTPQQTAAFQKVMQTIGGLQYQSGEISLVGGKAKVKLSDDFRFLDPANARKVLVDVWNNPPEAGSVTGMIVPKDINFLDENGWAAIIQWKDEGYVKDSDFEGTDFNKMLTQLKEQSAEANKERVSRGYPPMELSGWATEPHYDKASHKLFWAKSYKVNGPDQQLNYDIRVLGRSGYFEISILAAMSQLHDIEAKAPTILGMVDFADGNRYADFKPGTDKVAAYGIAGLIAGGVLAKAGFFKVAWLFAAKFIKVIIVGIVALFAGIGKLLGKKKSA